MAIGGYETPVVYGHTQLFDPTMAAMVLDVNKRYGEALKAEYERGLKDLEDFSTKYGDFISPFSKDMERYGEMMGNIKLVIDQAYANGIDLTRSPEGRLLISRMTHSIDPAEFNNMRSNAKLGYEYLSELLKARARGEFDQDYENWLLQQEGGPGLFDDFSSSKGMWNRPGPARYQDPNTMVSPLFEHMEDAFIDSDGQYDYSGVDRKRRAAVLSANLDALLKTDIGRYHYEISKARALQKYGPNTTSEDIYNQYQNDLLDASNRFEHRTRTENKEFARRQESLLRMEEDTHRTKNDNWLDQLKLYRQHYYSLLEKEQLNTNRNVFREAEALIPSGNKAHDFSYGTSAGTSVGYLPSALYEELIDPVIPASYLEQKDKDSGQTVQVYRFNASKIKDNVYTIDDGGNVKKSSIRFDESNPSTSCVFVPDGQIRASKTPMGGYKYYISGTITGNKSNSSAYREEDGSTLVWIEVKERGYAYDGKKQNRK